MYTHVVVDKPMTGEELTLFFGDGWEFVQVIAHQHQLIYYFRLWKREA